MERHALEGLALLVQERAPDANERRRSIAERLSQAFGIDLLDAETILVSTTGNYWHAGLIAYATVRTRMPLPELLEIVRGINLTALMHMEDMFERWLEAQGVVLEPVGAEPDWGWWRDIV